jgi:hypothetical protein
MPSTSLPLESSATSPHLVLVVTDHDNVVTRNRTLHISRLFIFVVVVIVGAGASTLSLTLRLQFESVFSALLVSFCLNASYFTGSNFMFARRCLWQR